MKNFKLIIPVAFVVLCSCSESRELTHKDNLLIEKRNVALNDTVLKASPKFIPLAPGVVTPKGWIANWGNSAISGITGHLDEWVETYKLGWTGNGINAFGADKEDGTGWPLEQSAYWLDGAIRMGYIMNDSALIEKVSKRLDLIVNGVLNNNTDNFIFWKKLDISGDEFNSWSNHHIARALLAYYDATGNKRILDALSKVYGSFSLNQPLENNFMGHNGIPNIEPMLEVYRLTKNPNIIDSIKVVIKDPKFQDAIDEWNKGNIPVGHGVDTYSDSKLPAFAYLCNGEKRLLQASESCYKWIDENHMQPYGVPSSEEHLAGIGSTRHTETCDIAASEWAYQKLLEITGNSSYADKIENAFFNAGPSAVARDFKTMSYYQCPNRVQDILPGDEPRNPGVLADYMGTEWTRSYNYTYYGHECLCCVGNMNRVIPFYIMHMWMGTLDNGLVASLYGPSQVNTVAGQNNTPVQIVSETNYPFNENISMLILPSKKVRFPLYLRIPEWCDNPKIEINNKDISCVVKDGYMVLNREWSKGDKVNLKLPMSVRIIEGRETSMPQTSYFTQDNRLLASIEVNSPYKSVYYGPLLFALPLQDKDANNQAENQKWNYALNISTPSDAKVLVSDLSEEFAWDIARAPIKIEVPAMDFNWSPTPSEPLPKDYVKGINNDVITLVPFNCTKFRISMFPVVALNN